MMTKSALVIGVVSIAYFAFVAWLGNVLSLHGTSLWVFQIALWLLGLAAAGITYWLLSSK